ncbi:MAG: type II toxin-antitoxin system VapC family toxin [Limisphaerales bacterium]
MDGFVVDASVAVAWVHPAQATVETDTLLQRVYEGAPIEVPAIWPVEISDALLVLERRKKITRAERETALTALRKLSVKVDHEMAGLAFTKLSDLASKYQLSAYDAAYLELAHRRKLLLACKDASLRSAATSLKVRLI